MGTWPGTSTGGGGGTPTLVVSHPVDGAAASHSGTYGSFDTPWTVSINAADGEAVLVRCYGAPGAAADVIRGFALKKGSDILIKQINYDGGRGNGGFYLEYLDEAPTVGENTYEVLCASSGGSAITFYNGAPNTNFAYNGEEQTGPALLTAQIVTIAEVPGP